ncbi:phage tail protein [Dickeya zeae]|uniref:P2 phage tail completion R family protein n=1 Tax=Dickeya zeae (strain Ech586) TaxID=590409 RepID=D2BYI7_DICZ5|nr:MULTISPECIES: phage tail protein [Dickeya]ACZ76655.1 P2 phage tail completion R family protein [Dickeya parazeae Ech586]UCZ74963.1 phage tail protein [Dickeya zeae]
MQKPQSLRLALTTALPSLSNVLQFRIQEGEIAALQEPSLSFEYRYQLLLTLNNFADNPDTLFVTLLLWVRQNQPDLLTRESIRNKGISFTVDNNADNTSTLSIRLNLTERNRVSELNQTVQVNYEPEPTPPEPVSRPTALYIAGELISQWKGN